MAKSNRERQATYRDRKLKLGCTIVTVILDPETSIIVKGLRGNELSTFVCQAIKETVISNKQTSKTTVTSNKVNSKIETVINNKEINEPIVISNKPNRYMSADLEDYILKLREEGLKLKEVSARLADEGFLSITGKPYSTGTISKAEKRRARR